MRTIQVSHTFLGALPAGSGRPEDLTSDRTMRMASESELRWWNRFADVMATQWNLTPRMNRAVRAEYERDYEEFLWKSGGTLLDVGCGTGARTHELARRGMQVDGIDFSARQLELARRLAEREGIPAMQFFQRDLVRDEWRGRHQQYDSVFINALLHHLTSEELDLVFARLRACVRPGGRVYLYEPLLSDGRRPWWWPAFKVLDFFWRAGLGVYMRAGRKLGWFDRPFREAMRDGYTGISPDERPILIEHLRRAVGEDFDIVECRPRHQYSISYAMSIMLLPARSRRFLEPLASLAMAADRLLFRLGMWESNGLRIRWILCAVKLQRRA
ncbi:MAG TPA: class I SAM-dependent methyltransferase [Gemmatimonadales bacterium]|nr:class I SAM-dependent methyltransferase [Gemmatimonadales bacterium]